MPKIWVEISATMPPGSSEGYTPAYKQFDWPVVPRAGEMVFINSFNEELKVQNVIHSLSEGKIIVCFEVSEKEFEDAIDDNDKSWLNEEKFAKAK